MRRERGKRWEEKEGRDEKRKREEMRRERGKR